MRNKTAKASIAIVSALLAMTITACGGSTPSTPTSQSGAPSTSSTSTSTSTSVQPSPTPTPVVKKPIALLSPANGSEHNVQPDAIMNYLKATNDTDAIAALEASSHTELTNPGVTIAWESNKSSYYNIHLSRDPNFQKEEVFQLSGLLTSYELKNLIPNTTYYWKISGTKSNDSSEIGNFVTKGESATRLITAGGGSNIRDLGGYTTGDTSVKYGMIYRGGCLNGYGGANPLNKDGIETFNNELGMNMEIDLRQPSVDDNYQSANWYDQSKPYLKANTDQYTRDFDLTTFNLLRSTDPKLVGNATAPTALAATSINSIFEALAEEDNYPIYMHCNAGADRTGTVSFLINGLLGVSYEDLIRDFELTSFSSKGARYRSALTTDKSSFTTDGVYQADGGNFVAFGAYHDAIVKYYGNKGALPLSKAIENYLIGYAGVPYATLARIKSLLLENYDPSTEGEIKVLTERQTIDVSSSTKSITIPGISDVTEISLGSISLGTNLESLNTSKVTTDKHGEKTLTVRGKMDGKNVVVSVPVLFVTKTINTLSEFLTALDFKDNKPVYGYYELGQDIGSASDNLNNPKTNSSNSWTDTIGFQGTLDGKGHSITGKSANNGLFGTLGSNGVVKNLTINCTSYVAVSSQNNIFGNSILGATLDNVTINVTNAPTSPVLSNSSWHGLLCNSYARNATYKKVTLNAQGFYFDSIFGGSNLNPATTHNGYEINTNKFINCSFNYADSYEFVHNGNTSFQIYDEASIGGHVNAKTSEVNTINLVDGFAEVYLGQSFENFTAKSIKYGDKNIPGYLYEDGLFYFLTEGIFTDDDKGLRNLNAVVINQAGLELDLTVPVNIKSTYIEKLVGTVNDIDYSNTSTYKLDLGEYDVPAYTNYIEDIKLGDISLGKNPNALDLSEVSDPLLHGKCTIDVLINKSTSEKYDLVCDATIITKLISSYADFRATFVTPYNGSTVTAIFGYYKLTQDIGDSSTAFNFDNGTINCWNTDTLGGFRGTFDGDNHTIYGNSSNSSSNYNYGLFGTIGRDAVIKNLKIVDYQYYAGSGDEANKYSCVLAGSIYNATLENINVTLSNSGYVSGTAFARSTGWICSLRVFSSKLTNCNFDCSGLYVPSIFGTECPKTNSALLSNTFTNVVIKGKPTYLSANGDGNYACLPTDSVTGIVFIEQ